MVIGYRLTKRINLDESMSFKHVKTSFSSFFLEFLTIVSFLSFNHFFSCFHEFFHFPTSFFILFTSLRFSLFLLYSCFLVFISMKSTYTSVFFPFRTTIMSIRIDLFSTYFKLKHTSFIVLQI